jgi:Ca2+-binding RTX toxin-like protein
MIAMLVSSTGGNFFVPSVNAQTAPVGAGFVVDVSDLRFILKQIQIAENHVATGELFGLGANQVPEPRLPFGLRTVDGSYNHLVAGQTKWGAADEVFPRLTASVYRAGETFDPDGPGPAPAGPTSYTQKSGAVADSAPRVISNLIADQTVRNPAAVFVSEGATPEPLGTLPIGNVAPDEGLSAPFNSMFTFFGQFFDHGLDLVTKGGGTVIVPLKADDPLIKGPDGIEGNEDDLPPSLQFMALTRATNQPGPDGVLGTADDVQEATNTTTPFVDQNQTYTSHPSHQVFLREYELNAAGRPVATGRLIDGGGVLKNIGNWTEVKAQAADLLGIQLVDADITNVPMLMTDLYGRFVRGANGYPQMVTATGLVEGNPAANGGLGVLVPANAARTGHAFLDDIAHHAAPGIFDDHNPSTPNVAKTPDADPGTADDGDPSTYDDELLGAHFITGDGRGNENIALTAVHAVFHAEHNRLAAEIDAMIDGMTADEQAAWRSVNPASGWDGGERLFQAARFVTEMEYQHLVFEEFARKLAPSINAFVGDGINFTSDVNPAISAEFAHAVYRLGHSMLTETIARTNADGSINDIPLLDGFLNPLEFNNGGTAGILTAAEAAGAIFQGGTRQVGAQIDEFVTEAVRNRLLGLPLDLAVLNLARGRSEGLAPLNSVRRQLFNATGDAAMTPYTSWADFEFALRNQVSIINFIAAYGVSPLLTSDMTVDDRRAAAAVLYEDGDFMFGDGSLTGVENIDLWMGGLAENIAPFGGMLGTTFNFIFERQLENLQNADRFYYLERLDGLNLLAQLEANSFAELIARNTTLDHAGADVFGRPDLVFDLSAQTDPLGIVDDLATEDVDERLELSRMPDGTIRYSGGAHIIFSGSPAGDKARASIGDDTLRGNDGNDRMEGGAGNDQHIGGLGDDILTDVFGDDVIKGGPGNDAISGGSGADLLQGNEGHDFIVAGNDSSETFGGSGNDVIYVGAGVTEAFGGGGDDWIEGSDSPASVLVGDENNQFQNDPNGGHDVIVAGPGDADFDSEGGDDIMIANVLPTHRLEGMLGFDWAIYRGEIRAVDADMLVTGATAVNAPLNENRDRYDNTEGLSGTNFNDLLRGDDRTETELRDDGLTGVVNGHVLTSAGMARIDGIEAILPGASEFAGGNIILGGPGSDLIEGRGGNDVIDGDRWMNAQLEGTLTDGVTKVRANSLQELKTYVFGDPQTLRPGDIRIVREIVTPAPNDAEVDTAQFTGNRAEYSISVQADGTVIVDHGLGGDGADTLRNIELLAFADQTIPVPEAVSQVTVPNVVGQQQVDAEATILALGLGVVSEIVESAAPAGEVIAQSPTGGLVSVGSSVSLQISHGVELAPAPDVVGDSRGQAIQEINAAGFVVGTITTANSTTVRPGNVISQSPAAGAPAALEGPIDFVVSVGRPGLAIALNFDDAAGLAATDSSASGRNGAVRGAIPVAGMVGSALSFDGSDDWVTVLDGAAGTPMDLTTGMTLEAWVRPGAMPGWETIILKERGAGDFSYALYAQDGANLAGGARRPSGNVRTTTGQHTLRGAAEVPSGAWTHLATTYDGTTQRMFVNGVQVSSRAQSGAILVGNQPLRIGGNAAFSGEFYQGLIDEVRIYNRALTAAEITGDMNMTVATPPPPPPPPPGGATAGLAVSLSFNEATGDAADASGNGNVGTLVGATRVTDPVRGSVVSFDGVDDMVSVAAGPSLDFTTGMTLQAWVRPTELIGWETLILKERGGGDFSYALYAHDGGSLAGGAPVPSGNVRVSGAHQVLRGTSALPLNAWTHIATTYDGTTQRLYINGVEVSSRAQSGLINVGSGQLSIGGNNAFADEFFRGLIDDVKVYNRALTAAEIAGGM